MIKPMKAGLVFLLVVGLLSGGCAGPSAIQRPSQSAAIGNFQHVAPGVYRGAQPDEQGMQALRAMGIKTVVSLRVPPRVIAWEGAKAKALGMDFISLPISNYAEPSEADVKTFLTLVTDPQRQPVFVHCREGRLRTGALMASYRVREGGWRVDDAYVEAQQLGFHTHYLWYLPLKRFITRLDAAPARRTQVASDQPVPLN